MKKYVNNKGQVATEYLFLMAVLLGIIAIIAGYSFLTYQETVKMQNLNSSLNALGNAAKYVKATGSGNSILTKIILPEGITSSNISGGKITIARNGTDFTNTLDFNLSGTLPIEQGVYTIRVYATDNNVSFQAI
ncbi:MAG: hypothetical protein COT15_02755 [Candidatus Diapherotrites archaeon CG08_land_8_20_14_0_20_34_12]|nr:MAG: hypothetical protein COT15_02755 [Candidatus Diapherotrites archaeon CG08_land_8_20_14_0_20_34_12]